MSSNAILKLRKKGCQASESLPRYALAVLALFCLASCAPIAVESPGSQPAVTPAADRPEFSQIPGPPPPPARGPSGEVITIPVQARERTRGAIYQRAGPAVNLVIAAGENEQPGKVSFRGKGMVVPSGIERSNSGSVPEAWVDSSGFFNSTNFDDNATYNDGFVFIPPDSHAAAGPLHVVTVVNTTIAFHQKDGTQVFQDSLADFFSGLTPLTFTFDPKVIYDQYSERWLVVTMEQTAVASGDASNTSRIFLAVSDDENPSDDGNPGGTWYVTEFNSNLPIGGNDHWADYPGFAVGEEAVYITANMFPFAGGSGGVRLWIVDKGDGSGGYYDGSAASFSLYDPYASPPEAISTTTQPAHMYGAIPGATDTYLVSYSGLNDGTDEYLQVVRVDDPLGTPTFTHSFHNFGDQENTTFGLNDAPQSGSGTNIEVNDRRALDAVWIDNALWMAATIRGPGAGGGPGIPTYAYWWQVDTTTPASLSILDHASIEGADIAADAFTFFPSVGVNGYGDVTIGFSASAATIFPGAYFVTREAGDPAGTMGASQTVAAGTDTYVRTFGGARNRWGDYSATVVDPVDGCFWIYNEYAMTGGTIISGEDGRWATAAARSCNLTHPCSDSVNIAANTWTRFALPCNVAPSDTVQDIFSGLLPGDYGTGWRVYRLEMSGTPAYEQLALTDTMAVGEGHWVTTNTATTVNINGTINPLDDIDLESDPAGLQNYIGHNQDDSVSWADIRFVDGEDLLTLDEAEAAGAVSRLMYKWNGAAYQVFNGIDPQTGAMDSFDGFWVKAFDPGIKIRIPQANAVSVAPSAMASAQRSAFESSSTVEMRTPGEVERRKRFPRSWHIRLTASSGELVDPGNFFGRKGGSSERNDMHDLVEPAPFGSRYLTVLFTNPRLRPDEWGYTSDFRRANSNPKGEWPFVVKASSGVDTVTLSWEGEEILFDNAWLTDEGTGELLKVHSGESYTFDIVGGERHFTFEME